MCAKSRTGRMAMRCGLPEDAVTDCARVTLFGRTAALVEGQQGVVEMAQARIRLRTPDGVISVCGTHLTLTELSLDAAMIRAQEIEAVTYARPSGKGD